MFIDKEGLKKSCLSGCVSALKESWETMMYSCPPPRRGRQQHPSGRIVDTR